MRQINVSLGQRSYPILIGPGLLGRADERLSALPVKRWAVVADETAASLYAGSLGLPVYAFPAGEGSKCLAVYESLCRRMLADGFTRADGIVALGGGVAGDLAGFLAGTILRGVPLVQMPTTLLAQVDSSVGGKVGVDFRGVKNLIGAFYQPRLVYMAQSTLSTLPRREYGAGMAEVLKTALIWDEGFWDFLRQNRAALLARDEEALREAQRRCCAAKAAVVARDERESGLREILNFGHTVGHAVESCLGFRLLHGECVGLGMLCALRLSGLPTDTLRDELRAYGLPERVEGLTKEEIYEQMFLDKKVRDGKLRFVLLSRVGKAYSTDEVSRAALFDALEEIV